jgi:hypothetical protein
VGIEIGMGVMQEGGLEESSPERRERLSEVRTYLSGILPGPILESSEVEHRLAECWDSLAGDDQPLKVKPLAHELADAVTRGRSDDRLKWKTENCARILIGVVIPATDQTTSARRKRFWTALKEELSQDGWVVLGQHVFRKGSQECVKAIQEAEARAARAEEERQASQVKFYPLYPELEKSTNP